MASPFEVFWVWANTGETAKGLIRGGKVTVNPIRVTTVRVSWENRRVRVIVTDSRLVSGLISGLLGIQSCNETHTQEENTASDYRIHGCSSWIGYGDRTQPLSSLKLPLWDTQLDELSAVSLLSPTDGSSEGGTGDGGDGA